MKVYVLKEEDFTHLRDLIHKDYSFRRGFEALSVHDQALLNDVHRFFNLNVENWIQEVTK